MNLNENYWIDFLDKNAEVYDDKIAVIDQQTNTRLTYKELQTEVEHLASMFMQFGVKKGDPVAFLAPTNCLFHLTLMLASAKVGALFVPMNFRLSNAELEGVLESLAPKLFINTTDKKLKTEAQEINIEEMDYLAFTSLEFNPSKMDETILILYTSGSTGKPKGVMFHGEMLLANQVNTCEGWGLRPEDITLVETPFFHTGGYNVLLLPLLYLGGTVILADSFKANNVFDSIENERVSVYFGVPTMFQMLSEHERFKTCDFSSVRFFVSGGAACSIPMITEYQKKGLMFKQGFGLTEVGPNCFVLDEKDAIRKQGSIGRPMPHSQARVINKEKKDVETNTPGELVLKGPHVCKGYYKNSKAFEETMIDGYFATGDLVRRDEEGFFYVVGRIKDMYISGGENVYPGEVEKQLTTHPDISEAVVVAVPNEKWGEVGFSFLKSEKDLSLDEVRDFLNNLLSRYKHPHYVKTLKEFPLLANGKVDRKALKEMSLSLI